MRRPAFPLLALLGLLLAGPLPARTADLAIAREALAALAAVDPTRVDRDLGARIAGQLARSGDCAAAEHAMQRFELQRIVVFEALGSRDGVQCLLRLTRPWLVDRPANAEEAQRLHVAAALLRRAGERERADEATARAEAVLARPIMGDPRLQETMDFFRALERRLIGGPLPAGGPLWDARESEVAILSGTPALASRLRAIAADAVRQPGGVEDADRLARMAFEAGLSEIGRQLLAAVPARDAMGSRAAVQASILSEFGTAVEAFAAMRETEPEDREQLLTFIHERMHAFLAEEGRLSVLFPEPSAQAVALAELAGRLRLSGQSALGSDVLDRAIRLADRALLSPDQRRQIVNSAAFWRRADAVDRLIASAPASERPALWTEAAHGALRTGDWTSVDRALAAGASFDGSRLMFISQQARDIRDEERPAATGRALALAAAVPAPSRKYAVRSVVSGVRTPAEFALARAWLAAQPATEPRGEWLIALGHAMMNARHPDLAATAADAAGAAVASGERAEAEALAWLYRRVGRRDEALRLARGITEPGRRAALLWQLAESPPTL
jgi:tetratricopeptide (TPR) repeat protein